jgi:hypothetical protein
MVIDLWEGSKSSANSSRVGVEMHIPVNSFTDAEARKEGLFE